MPNKNEEKTKKEKVNEIWKLQEKTRMNISVPNELADWLDDNASKHWKLDKAARSKEVTCILTDAKNRSDQKKKLEKYD